MNWMWQPVSIMGQVSVTRVLLGVLMVRTVYLGDSQRYRGIRIHRYIPINRSAKWALCSGTYASCAHVCQDGLSTMMVTETGTVHLVVFLLPREATG